MHDTYLDYSLIVPITLRLLIRFRKDFLSRNRQNSTIYLSGDYYKMDIILFYIEDNIQCSPTIITKHMNEDDYDYLFKD